MKFTVSETAKLTGVSVRTLHYYDEIGLLTPNEVVANTGYRYYSKQSIERLQQILFYRELDFPLKEIVKIMNNTSYNREDALRNQRELLALKRKRLDKLIELLDSNLKGDNTMSFNEFDMSEIEDAKNKYAKEAEERWGNSDAYKESAEKTKNYTKEDWANVAAESNTIMTKFAEHVGESPESELIQSFVEEWKNHISKFHYQCGNEILAGLGEMYVADERFTKNIDKFGEGTAKLISDAIRVYCSL
ncbi:MerR family transcriptional regulator [Anaerosporobacter sp.]|uniref:MerR family transcriptional regulator n=1 Tax=Anaerosporobacter sp. TaxID=1872529 RepID=UPI00286F0DEA|nr:MerR family transcriptional regulator [Anaerosporobacter sp.]